MPDRYGYFEPSQSIAWQSKGHDIEHVLLTIAGRYTGDHPAHSPIYRVTRNNPIQKQRDHRYVFPLDDIFPEMQLGQKVVAWAKLWSDEEQANVPFQLNCAGPVQLYLNGVKQFGSAQEEEGLELAPLKLFLKLKAGWNHFVLEFTKGAQGSGGVFGTGNRKNAPYHFLAPSTEREGEEGWIFTEPLDQLLSFWPQWTLPESATGTKWLPDLAVTAEEEERLDRIFSTEPGQIVYAWSKLFYSGLEASEVSLKGYAYGPLAIMINGELSERIHQAGSFEININLSRGMHDLLIRSEHGEVGCGFTLTLNHERCALHLPMDLKGKKDQDHWLYLGPFPADAWIEPNQIMSLNTLLKSEDGGLLFWRLASTQRFARPFLENELFGRWNYPLGVTLYGLIEVSKELSRGDILDYVLRHVEFATSTYEYSLWDRAQFGAAGLNNQLSDIDSLDDCGSFGALMLLANQERELQGAGVIADTIADYVMNRQDRMPDGALYRKIGVSESMHHTMWCDDMYMSVPFLIRYAERTGDQQYIDEAARQLLLYKKYLYMPELQIMAHVYDVKAGKPSLTPWGRGNGWVIFALTELLTVLPKTHPNYTAILEFYRQLAEGYLKLQGVHGLWHQVLTDPESYEEASCTSMFIYSFAKGVRYGWLEEPEAYADAVFKGWRGLCERAIDQYGNVYGVCRGSSWSYSNHYYKHQLTWRLNDTHGIGIILLAGLETHRLNKSLNMR